MVFFFYTTKACITDCWFTNVNKKMRHASIPSEVNLLLESIPYTIIRVVNILRSLRIFFFNEVNNLVSKLFQKLNFEFQFLMYRMWWLICMRPFGTLPRYLISTNKKNVYFISCKNGGNVHSMMVRAQLK